MTSFVSHFMSRRNIAAALVSAVVAVAVLQPPPAAAQTRQGERRIIVTDLAGRTVSVRAGAERVILGEGRLLYGTGILDKDQPFRRIVGWADDMITYDPGSWRAYRTRYPQAESVPRFGSAFSGDFSAEKAIALNPDVVLLPLSGLFKVKETGLIEKLEKVGIPALFVDLREEPLQNTVPTIRLLGQVFGREAEAQAFLDFYEAERRKVADRVAGKAAADRPLVIMERAAGYDPSKCCMTFGKANLGAVLDAAGGRNWGSSRFPGLGGDINPEALFAEDPFAIVGTGADWAEAVPGSVAVPFGYETNPEAVQRALRALAERKGWSTLSAVRSKRFFSIYHQFYTSPAHVVALQVFAKWLHPADFQDLDPEATWRVYHERFSPIPLSGVFWAQLR
jgi:iron complex transport system substrate-binding protein